ncbi:MAG: SDR family oxidoreductase [Opitutales bacterium]|nr:SDR family oxidoreductase [Opitutales bacterium]
MRILVTGATGYVGGRLVPRLIEQGHDVTVFVRNKERIKGRLWYDSVQVIIGDLTHKEDWEHQVKGFDAAYYLVHSMSSEKKFSEVEAIAAKNFAQALQGTKHVIYLGGLLPASDESVHLSSRAATGRILSSHLQLTEFRAGPIIGSGSASFEMIRYLTERLPIMIAPKWVKNLIQPIAIRDVLSYLIEALNIGPSGIVDIGSNVVTFKDMIYDYAEVRGLKRKIISVPVLTPYLAGLWIGLVTPIQNRLALPIVAGIIKDLVADTHKARTLFPNITPISYKHAVKLALEKVYKERVETHWAGALGMSESNKVYDEQGAISEVRTRSLNIPATAVFHVLSKIGGQHGWFVWNWAWNLRGAIDKCIGGPGLRRGRRHPTEMLAGETIDFWRVEKVTINELIILKAEMKLPGTAWLKWQIFPEENGCKLIQSAIFHPKGFSGVIYWYSLYPIHKFIFSDLINAICKQALKYNVEVQEPKV